MNAFFIIVIAVRKQVFTVYKDISNPLYHYNAIGHLYSITTIEWLWALRENRGTNLAIPSPAYKVARQLTTSKSSWHIAP